MTHLTDVWPSPHLSMKVQFGHWQHPGSGILPKRSLNHWWGNSYLRLVRWGLGSLKDWDWFGRDHGTNLSLRVSEISLRGVKAGRRLWNLDSSERCCCCKGRVGPSWVGLHEFGICTLYGSSSAVSKAANHKASCSYVRFYSSTSNLLAWIWNNCSNSDENSRANYSDFEYHSFLLQAC